ncbi:MAG: SH3 domain-containing protein [Tatlockia sp.]|nr:SH3 domain-containing protein [Tatlockia sp.]
MLERTLATILFFFSHSLLAMEVPIYDFSLKPYSQNINDFLSPNSNEYTKPLLNEDYQKQQLKRFYNHYFESDSQGLSPWSETLVKSVLPLVKAMELEGLESFNNQNKAPLDRHYAENFKEQSQGWWNKIKLNMNLDSLEGSYFNEENRAIAISNTYARSLPELAPDFFHASLAGQGFPFDNLQDSAVWAGTPLYVLTTTKDKAWSLVLTPDAFFAWIKSSDLAYASSSFIDQWQQAAKKNLVAISKTEATIVDTQQRFQLTSYIGAVFPLKERGNKMLSILIPEKNDSNQAYIKSALISANAAVLMPLAASNKNLAAIIRQLQNRPYGWGDAFFYNDCSQEMKSLFTPFGIWLPRNSNAQGELKPSLDLSSASLVERLAALKAKGHPMMTLVYIGGHVMLYLGNKNQEAMSYQNVWGLAPKNRDKRYVIGQSVLLPILKSFPENAELGSQANRNFFKLIFLDELESKSETPKTFLKLFADRPDKPQDLRD